jgi:hypothetical protein
MKALFTKEEIDFMIKNYPSKGLDYCVKYIKKPEKQIKCKIGKLRTEYNFKLDKNIRFFRSRFFL